VVRVAVISSGLISLPPVRGGAVEEYVYQLVKHLRRIGIDAVAVDFAQSYHVVFDEVDGVPILRVPILNLRSIPKELIAKEYLFGLRTVRAINEVEAEIVHVNTAWAGFALALNLKGIPLIYTCHNPLWPEDKVHMQERVVRLVESYTMRRSTVVVALNNIMRRSLIEKAKVDEEKIVTVPNGVDTEFFRPGIPTEDVVKRYRLEGRRVILFVGRVTYGKGVHILLKAFSALVKKYPNLKLVVAGPLSDRFGDTKLSQYARVLMTYAEKKLPRNSYVFTGAVDRETLRKLYSTAYVCVLPSYFEAFSNISCSGHCLGMSSNSFQHNEIPELIGDTPAKDFVFYLGRPEQLIEKIKIVTSKEPKDIHEITNVVHKSVYEKNQQQSRRERAHQYF